MYIGLWIQIEEGEIAEDVSGAPRDANKEESIVEAIPRVAPANQNERKPSNWLRRDGFQRPSKMVNMDGTLLGRHTIRKDNGMFLHLRDTDIHFL